MSKLRLNISMSLDGFVAGPDQSVENPLGVGGMRLHEWAFPLESWRAPHGLEGGEVNESSAVVEEGVAKAGATIMGRNMFGGHPGRWDADEPWNGWWGDDPPFHHPVFVLTHHAREPLVWRAAPPSRSSPKGSCPRSSRRGEAAGGKDVSLAGGAQACREYLAAGLVDEMVINLAPTLLGAGERLFEGLGDDLHGLEPRRSVAAPAVTHLFFARS